MYDYETYDPWLDPEIREELEALYEEDSQVYSPGEEDQDEEVTEDVPW